MDIKDKMLEAINGELWTGENLGICGIKEAAESCAKIAEQERDEFAIEFTEWLDDTTMQTKGDLTTAELLQIFKQSKSNN